MFLFCSLTLAALIADVFWLMPKRPAQEPQTLHQQILQHQSQKNFSIAMKMILKLLPSPATGWSGPTQIGELGRGVWYAEGEVGMVSDTKSSLVTPTAWEAVFVPATDQPLYLAVGSQRQGDFAAALRQAGRAPVKP